MNEFYQLTLQEQADRLQVLARSALAYWDIGEKASLTLIKHRENAVFEVVDGEVHMALRVHRANYHTDQELHSELQWIEAINSPELKTPQVVRTATGELFVRHSDPAVPEERQVDALEWIDGEPMGSVEEGVADQEGAVKNFLTMGRLMAIAHNHAQSWQLPAGFKRHAWDKAGLLGEQPFWGRFWELAELTEAQRHRMQAVRKKAGAELEAYTRAADRYGLIHADFVPENLLLSGDRTCLIDFDDSGFGWHLFDIATSLFFHLGQTYYEDASQAFFEGYSQCRKLPDQCTELLPLFFLLRGTTYLGWMHTRREVASTHELVPIIIALVDQMAEEYL